MPVARAWRVPKRRRSALLNGWIQRLFRGVFAFALFGTAGIVHAAELTQPPGDTTGPPGAVDRPRQTPAGTAIDNSARVQFTTDRDGDSFALTNVSNTVTIQVELISHLDISEDVDTRFVRTGRDDLFIKRMKNMGNGADTVVSRIISTLPAGQVRMFVDADSDVRLTAADPPFETVVLRSGEETAVLIVVQVPDDRPDRSIDTIFIIFRSMAERSPAIEVSQIVLTVDVAPPTEAPLIRPADGERFRSPDPEFIWNQSVDTGSGLSIYNIELTDAADTDFTDTLRGAYLTDTRWTATPDLPNGRYRWRVRAIDQLGNITSGLETRIFAIDTRILAESSPIGVFVLRTHPEGGHCSYVLAPQVESGLLPIWVQFNVPIDPAGVSTSTIRLLDGDGTDRTQSILMTDDRTVRINSTYGDTAWPYGSRFFIRVGTGIRNFEDPPDSLPSEHVTEFRTFLNSQARQTISSTDRKAELRIDSGDIDPAVKGIAVEIHPADPADPPLARMLESLKTHPYYAFIPGPLPVYDFKILTHATDRCEDGMAPISESRIKHPLDISITVRKPEFLLSKGAPLNSTNLALVHFKNNPGDWEILPDITVEDHGETVSVRGSTRSFSPFGVLFAFAPPSVRETFRSYPNPADPFMTYSNPSGTWQGFRFGWNMPKSGVITIRIYDFAGEIVRTIGPAAYAAGDYFAQVGATWDGRNGRGQTVLNGAYFVRVQIQYNDGSVESATDRIAVVK